ncbi:20642_t:CDS:1, partial [Funneliformis geosporum]
KVMVSFEAKNSLFKLTKLVYYYILGKVIIMSRLKCKNTSSNNNPNPNKRTQDTIN